MPRIHITGASGTGTTTLGRALAQELRCAHFDSDNDRVPKGLRLARLRRREERMNAPAPDREELLAWAAAYDEAGMEMRSRTMHERWLAALTCPVLRLEGDLTTGERLRRVRAALTMPL